MITEFTVKSDYVVKKVNGKNKYTGTVTYNAFPGIGMATLTYTNSDTVRISKSIPTLEHIKQFLLSAKLNTKLNIFNADFVRIEIHGSDGRSLLYDIVSELLSEMKGRA